MEVVKGRSVQMKEIFESLAIISRRIAFFQEYVATQRFGEALACFSLISGELNRCLGFLIEDERVLSRKALFDILEELNAAMVSEDLNLLSDLLGQMLLPYINMGISYAYGNYPKEELGLKEEISVTNPDTGAEYAIEYNNSGEAVLVRRYKGKCVYYHSNVCAKLSAYRFAKEYVDSSIDQYVVLGLGLGYEIAALEKEGFGAQITVYEPDPEVYKMWQQFGVVLRSKIVVDAGYKQLTDRLSGYHDGMRFVILRPCLITIEDNRIRKSFEDFFWVQNSVNDQKMALEWNFRNNMKLEFYDLWQLLPAFSDRTVIFVAAGPSLDRDVEELRQYCGKVPVICVGTVYKKLLEAGINPDYVAVSDVKDNIYRQVITGHSDNDNDGAALIALSTANHRACAGFSGDVYIGFQNGFAPAEKEAQRRKAMTFDTGGSVSCFIVDMLIRFGCDRVVCLGLDMAYTDGLSHASGTDFADSRKGSRSCTAVDGGTVEVPPNLELYRRWIEDRIAGQGVVFVNTARGAYIRGMEHMDFKNAMKSAMNLN